MPERLNQPSASLSTACSVTLLIVIPSCIAEYGGLAPSKLRGVQSCIRREWDCLPYNLKVAFPLASLFEECNARVVAGTIVAGVEIRRQIEEPRSHSRQHAIVSVDSARPQNERL